MVSCAGLVIPGIVRGDELANATETQEHQIFTGCLHHAEMTLYIAQERLYNNGSATRLMDYLRKNMDQAEYALAEHNTEVLGEWVDIHDYATAKEYARNLFYECVSNSYQYMAAKPTDRSTWYITQFEELLKGTEEKLFPDSLNGKIEA